MRILLLSILAAIGYGILHDMVTAHVCVEYFTVAHPFVIASQSPIVLALVWGVIATWWVGLILGLGLTAAANLGSRPRIDARDLAPRIGRLLLVMAGVALLAGVSGYFASTQGWIWLLPPLSEEIDASKHHRFFFDAFAHTGSYAGGFLGGLALIVQTWRRRRRLNSQPDESSQG